MKQKTIYQRVTDNARAGKGVSLDWVETQRLADCILNMDQHQRDILMGRKT